MEDTEIKLDAFDESRLRTIAEEPEQKITQYDIYVAVQILAKLKLKEHSECSQS